MTLSTTWKVGQIIPVSKKAIAKVDNDVRPVTLTRMLSKCLKRIIQTSIKEYILPLINPLQFAYLANQTTGDTINTLLEYTTCYLDKSSFNYVRFLFIDCSSAFITMQPHLLINKVDQYNLHPSLQLALDAQLANKQNPVRKNLKGQFLKCHHQHGSTTRLHTICLPLHHLHQWHKQKTMNTVK